MMKHLFYMFVVLSVVFMAAAEASAVTVDSPKEEIVKLVDHAIKSGDQADVYKLLKEARDTTTANKTKIVEAIRDAFNHNMRLRTYSDYCAQHLNASGLVTVVRLPEGGWGVVFEKPEIKPERKTPLGELLEMEH